MDLIYRDLLIDHPEFREDFIFRGDLKLSPGDRVRIAGPSGSGKTIFLKSLFLLRPIFFKEIIFNDQKILNNSDIEKLNLLRSKISLITQNPLLPPMSIQDYCSNFYQGSLDSFSQKWNFLFPEKNIQSKFQDRFLTLSGGEKQIALLIAHLSLHKSLILIDESFNALDIQTRLRLEDFIINNQGSKIILFTHHLDQQAFLSPNRIIQIPSSI